MSLQFSNRKLYLMRRQSSRNSDPIDTELNNDVAGREFVYQDVAELSIDPDAINDVPERETWSASGHKSPFVKNMAEVEGTLPLTAGVDGSSGNNGNPSPDDAPWYDPILKAMNLQEDSSNTGSDTYGYKPSTTPVNQATIYQFIRNVKDSKSRLKAVTDVQASGEISISTGEEATLSFSGAGYYESIRTDRDYIGSDGKIDLDKDGTDLTGQANAPTYTLADESPLIPKNMTVSIGGNSYDISEFTLDFNWTQDNTDAVTNTPGHMDHVNTRGKTDGANGGFTLVNSTASNFDSLITDYEAANEININIVLNEVGGSRSITIDVPKAQLGIEDEGENGNLMQHEFQFRCNRDTSASLAGDNDFTIKYSSV